MALIHRMKILLSVLQEIGGQLSLVLLSGEARYNWQHAIAPRKTDNYDGNVLARNRRLSLTFRSVILA